MAIWSNKFVPWIGEVLLNARSQDGDAVAVEVFMQEWKDCLPEPWMGIASLDVIKGAFVQPSSSTIRYAQDAQAGDSASKNASATKPTNRKWHEKFKQGRK